MDSEVFIITATLGYNDFHFYCLEGLGNKSNIKNRLLEADTAKRELFVLTSLEDWVLF